MTKETIEPEKELSTCIVCEQNQLHICELHDFAELWITPKEAHQQIDLLFSCAAESEAFASLSNLERGNLAYFQQRLKRVVSKCYTILDDLVDPHLAIHQFD